MMTKDIGDSKWNFWDYVQENLEDLKQKWNVVAPSDVIFAT